MTTAQPLDIRVVYDARSRRGRSGRYLPVTRKRRSTTWLLVGTLNLVAGAALCYVTLWHVDRDFLYERLILHTPFQGVDPEAAAGMLFGFSADTPKKSSRIDPDLEQAADFNSREPSRGLKSAAQATDPDEFSPATAQMLIPITANAWLALALTGSCALTLAGGAACGQFGGVKLRRIGTILALAAILIIAWRAQSLWAEYGMKYPTSTWRAGMVGLVTLSALVGLAIGRAPRGLARFAGVSLVLLAGGSVVGLYLGARCGAVDLGTTLTSARALFFIALQGLWGLSLLPIASRVAR